VNRETVTRKIRGDGNQREKSCTGINSDLLKLDLLIWEHYKKALLKPIPHAGNLADIYDHLPTRMTLTEILHGFSSLLKVVTPVDDGLYFSFFNKFYDEFQIFCAWLCRKYPNFFTTDRH
jgi:hypothetical protein